MYEQELNNSLKLLHLFRKNSVRNSISTIEQDLINCNKSTLKKYFLKNEINDNLLTAAFLIKDISSQIDVLVHAIGILLILNKILDDIEVIESLSIGAGNTGRLFDLETNKRVAEFKFIDWKDGAESIRQNSIFKDFYNLAESQNTKVKELYTFNKDIVLKFFRGKRTLNSILSKNNKLYIEFSKKYPDMKIVNEYYTYRKNIVKIIDISEYLKRT